MSLDLGSLHRALEAHDRGLGVIDDHQADARRSQAERDTLRAGVVQAFDFTYELCWEFMQRCEAFQESDLLFRVDLVEGRELSPEFRAALATSWEVIQMPARAAQRRSGV